MRFFSTRNEKNLSTFKEAVLRGLASDGGLFVPESFPQVDLKALMDLDYRKMAYEIIKLYATDFSEEELRSCIDGAYDDKFPKVPAPLVKAGPIHYLELYHGPTLAFKDFALSILPRFMEVARKSSADQKRIMILTATSGDTGSAALEGFSGLEGIDIGVFFPENGISRIQKLQMITTPSENTMVAGILGNFDDAQSAVKAMFADEALREEAANKGVTFSSANSINIGRLVPQIVYYFFAYSQLMASGEIEVGEEVTFSVPTGNFGDILALYYAKAMGLPVKKLIVASNENKVLTDFFTTGSYDKNRDLLVTNSPSMDIIISSNLERLLFDKTQDPVLVSKLQEDLKKSGRFSLDADFSEFYPGYCSQENTLKTIKEVFDEDGYLMDTHTAVGAFVARKYMREERPSEKIVVVSTASPYKFSDAIMKALGLEAGSDAFEKLDAIEKHTGLPVPDRFRALKTAEIHHKRVIQIDEMKDTVLRFIGDRHES